MPKRNQIKKTKIDEQSNIRQPQRPPEQHLTFSFKYTDLSHPQFSINNCQIKYMGKVIDRLKHISSYTVSQLKTNRSNALKAHPIRWNETTENNGFNNLNEQLKDLEAYQFQISSNEHGRIHGFFIDNTFFIVWFDPEHNLYT